jgi:hypothetical protein
MKKIFSKITCQINYNPPSTNLVKTQKGINQSDADLSPFVQDRIANATHCHSRSSPYPKPCNQTLRVQLAFLTLICSFKQA